MCIIVNYFFKVVKDINYLNNGRKNNLIELVMENLLQFILKMKWCLSNIEELYLLLKGYGGPYILTDKRYKDCKCL